MRLIAQQDRYITTRPIKLADQNLHAAALCTAVQATVFNSISILKENYVMDVCFHVTLILPQAQGHQHGKLKGFVYFWTLKLHQAELRNLSFHTY